MPLSTLALRRIQLDIKRVMELPAEEGMYWIPNETDINSGWAIVCGCADTPYYGGAFCFHVIFPDNYPFTPPKFKFLTQDGIKTRFNPNLYRDGKVCLSLLNTWEGEKWSAIQTMEAILRSIQTAVLNEMPLMNEPAHKAASDSTHVDIAIYNRMIFHATVKEAIIGVIKKPPTYVIPVYESIKAIVYRAKTALTAKLREYSSVYTTQEHVECYNMTCKYSFGALADELELL